MMQSPEVASITGYKSLPAPMLCMSWVREGKSSLLLLSLVSASIMGLLPDPMSPPPGDALLMI